MLKIWSALTGRKKQPVTEETPRGGAVAAPRRVLGPFSWTLEKIRQARDDQMRGRFEYPVRLAEAFRTDDALFVPYCARVSTQSALSLCWAPAPDPVSQAATDLCGAHVKTPQHVRQAILGTLANHGLAIGYVLHNPGPDGTTVEFTLSEWPLEHVYYDAGKAMLRTRTFDSQAIDITHGDGRWIVFCKFGVTPWAQDACVLPGALLWAAHALSISAWAGAADSHGSPKTIGKLPQGVKIGKDGALTPEGEGMLSTLARLMSGESDVGILPFGSEAEVLINESHAWQVFEKLSGNRERAAARVYLGTDAILGATGGAPGVDIEALFAVASTRLQSDVETLERGFREGMIVPWALMHAVDPALISPYEYVLPDPDRARKSEQEATAIQRLREAIENLKTAGVEITQMIIDALAAVLGVSVPVKLASIETKVVPLQLAPTDVAKVVTVNEARAAQGLPPREGGDITIAEQDALLAAKAKPAKPAPGEPPPEGEPEPEPAPEPEPPAEE